MAEITDRFWWLHWKSLRASGKTKAPFQGWAIGRWLQFRKAALITGIFCFHLGPLLHAEVGDSVLIVFKNKASRPYSVSAHGVEEVGCEEQTEAPITLPGKAVLIVFLSAPKAIYKKCVNIRMILPPSSLFTLVCSSRCDRLSVYSDAILCVIVYVGSWSSEHVQAQNEPLFLPG